MANIKRRGYMDILHGMVRDIQRYMKRHEAPVRRYGGKPRHVREALRHYDGNELTELVVLNAGMKDCGWGNCRMCGLSTRAESLTEENIESEMEGISRLPQLEKVGSLYISPYSFFADGEMPPGMRQKVYGIINSHPNIEYAVFMTRPDYLNERKLAELRGVLENQKVIVWMGAETANPVIAKYCIDKGYSWEDVERASELMNRYDIRTGVWVLQKPPFVSEREGIEDAALTIRKGLNNGYEIRLMPTEVMDFTVARQLFDMGRYKPPGLWSVIEVLKQFSSQEHMRIDVSGPHFERGWSLVPREAHSSGILEFPSNCPECDEDVFQAILDYNQRKRIDIFEGLDCRCRAEWQSELDRPMQGLEERLINDFSDLITYFVNTRNKNG